MKKFLKHVAEFFIKDIPIKLLALALAALTVLLINL